MNRRGKNILMTAAAAAAGAVAVKSMYDMTLNKLVGIAIGRETPQIMIKNRAGITGERIAYKALPEIAEGRAYLESCGCETHEIESYDGLKLVGHWYCPKNPKRVIIAMHGWRSSWYYDFGIIAPFWHESDCAVLYAEQRGQGKSGGEYIGFGLLERYDCLAWANWASKHTALPIYLAGVSMGASTVLMTTGFDLPERVCGVIADCGYTSAKAIWKHVVENNMHIPYSFYSAAVDGVCKEKIRCTSDGYSTTTALKNCKVPVLFVHGTEDRFVPVDMTYENYKACVSNKRLFIVPGAEHGMSYLVDMEGYQKQVKEFWMQCEK